MTHSNPKVSVLLTLLTPRMSYQREFLGHGLFYCGPSGALFRRDILFELRYLRRPLRRRLAGTPLDGDMGYVIPDLSWLSSMRARSNSKGNPS